MHYHAEVWIKEVPESRIALEKVINSQLARYDEQLEIEFVRDEEHDEEYLTNPEGFWDWWQIGGCWTGIHDDYDPADDDQNYVPCRHCGGTGFRSDALGQEYREKDPSYTCNACGIQTESGWIHGRKGPGMELVWPTNFASYAGNVCTVESLPDDFLCYMLVVNGEAFHIENGSQILVKSKLAELGIGSGYLVTVDYHN